MKFLISAFPPFSTLDKNPSLELLKILDVDDKVNHKLLIPVTWDKGFETLENSIKEIKPDYVIMLGAAGRDKFSFESTAHNFHDINSLDNNGNHPINEYIIENGPKELKATLDPNAFLKLFKELNIPCEISNDAGNYLCNETFYKCLYFYPSVKSIFIHVPTKLELNEVLKDGVKGFEAIFKNILK